MMVVLGTTVLLGGCAQNIYNQPTPQAPVSQHKPGHDIIGNKPVVTRPDVVKPITPSVTPPSVVSPSTSVPPTATAPSVVSPSVTPSQSVARTDVNSVAHAVINQMLNSDAVKTITANQSPVLWVGQLSNRTSDPINTSILSHQIQSTVMDSGLFSPVSTSKVMAARQQLNLQDDAQLVEQSAAVQFGKMVGAKYMLYGSISPSSVANTQYKVTLRLMALKSGLIEWSGHASQAN